MLTKTPLLLALLLAPLAQANGPDPRIAAELEATLLRLYEVGAFDGGAPDSPLLFESAPRSRFELGAVVDVAASDRGLPVMAVTPGSAADRLGLRAGDRLLRLNEYSLAEVEDPAASFVAAVQSSGGDFQLAVARDGREVQLSGQAEPTEVPGYRLQVIAPTSGCGRVSTFDVSPRNQHIYRAVLIAIDGKATPNASGESFRLPVGPHTLTVAEAIDPVHFLGAAQVVRDRGGRERYKTLEVDVRPNVTYRLAAQLHLDRRSEVRSGEYWDPVIWSEVTEACR